jgi:uncharacterized protein YqgC (DUF456 family)
LILAAALGHRLYFRETGPSNFILVLLVILTLLAWGLEYLASLLGAKKLGATWRGMLGATLGALVGLFVPPFGLLVGPFLGALLLEWASGRQLKEAGQAGLGAVVGMVAGGVAKAACCIAMIALFAVSVVLRS